MAEALPGLSDKLLLERWREGDRRAFSALFDRHFNKLLQFTVKQLRNRELAEELVMDVMIRVWENPDRLETTDSLGPYLFRSVKNGIIDHKRKRGLLMLELEQLTAKLPETHSVEDQYQADQLQQIYLDSMGRLSPQRRRVFELSRLEGKSHQEISAEMNLSVSTVKKHINASLHSIRESLKSHTDWVFLYVLLYTLFQ